MTVSKQRSNGPQASRIASARPPAQVLDRQERQGDAALRARLSWDQASPAGAHPYLLAQGIAAHGLRQRAGRLLVPMRDAAGELWNVLHIGAGGGERRLFGGRVAGLFHAIDGSRETIYIATSYAAAARLHAKHGSLCVVAFSADNMAPVGLWIRAAFPHAQIAVCCESAAMGGSETRRRAVCRAALATAEAVDGIIVEIGEDEAARLSAEAIDRSSPGNDLCTRL